MDAKQSISILEFVLQKYHWVYDLFAKMLKAPRHTVAVHGDHRRHIYS